MTTSNPTQTGRSVTSGFTNEVVLLEQLSLEDRKKDMRQLIKLLQLAKGGQAKSVLITGDQGIGKTALMNAFYELVRRAMFCRIVDLREVTLSTPEAFYVSLVEALQTEAGAILDEALEAANEVNQTLGIRWERQDLVRAISLVKLQESIGGKDSLTEERLSKAIKSAVPTVKKLQFSTVNDSVQQLVNIIVNPWLLVATNLLNPLVPPLQEALNLAKTLKTGQPEVTSQNTYTPEAPASPEAPSTLTLDVASGNMPIKLGYQRQHDDIDDAFDDISPQKSILAELEDTMDEGELLEGSLMSAASKSRLNRELLEGTPMFSSSNDDDGNDYPSAYRSNSVTVDTLVKNLTTIFTFINHAIRNLESGLVVLIDDWDQILGLDEWHRNDIKRLVADWMRETVDQKEFHLMVALGSCSQGESDALGGSLYSLFRNKLLLSGLSDRTRRRYLMEPLKEQGVTVDEAVLQQVFLLTRGNPYWLGKMRHYLAERASTNNTRHIDLTFYQKLGIEKRDDMVEAAFTRVKLAFMNEEGLLMKVVAALVHQFGEKPFLVQEAIRELSVSQGAPEIFVAEALRLLYTQHFLVGFSLPDSGVPHYQIQSKAIATYLREKTRQIQADVPTNEKIAYLKKIIPLSVKSGELDREKTQEVIALSTSMGNMDMLRFLEETFLEYLGDSDPIVRVTALNNLAVLDSDDALEAILKAMKDSDPMVREYAARNMAVLSRKPRETYYHDEIVDTLIDCIDDESELVRSQVYATLSRYKWSRELTSVFIKGMADASESVRNTSIQNLVELEAQSPLARATFMDALDDPSSLVRRYACLGIQRFADDETVYALAHVLATDPEPSNRSMAADVLSSMDGEKAMGALIKSLNADASEDVKLTVVRALGKRKGWVTEEALINKINQDHQMEQTAPALLWACIRSLGNVGGTERSLELLRQRRSRVRNEIIAMAIDVASRKIKERVNDLRLLERQLELATPVVSVDSESSDTLTLQEDDWL